MTPIDAAFWAFLSAIPLFVGTLVTRFFPLDKKIVVTIMAFGSGALISVVTFSLMREAYHLSGLVQVSLGFFVGAVIFTILNHKLVTSRIPKKKPESENKPTKGSGISMAIGSLVDNIPEGLAIGISLVVSGSVGFALVAAIAISNFSESIAGSNAMNYYKKGPRFIHGTWGLITIANVGSATLGFFFLQQAESSALAVGLAIAAGAILAMLVETMIPEVFKLGGPHISIATAAGFMFAFLMVILNTYEFRLF